MVTPRLLREWPLPEVGESKYSRGEVVVVGGSASAPGAAMLASRAALRVGAGRLTMAVAEKTAANVAVAVPESAVLAWREDSSERASLGDVGASLERANAVLLGPGLDSAEHTRDLLRELSGTVSNTAVIVLDAFALGAAARWPYLLDNFGGRLVLTPNKREAAMLLGSELTDHAAAIAEIACRFKAVVTCYGAIAHPDGRAWQSGSGASGLGSSGSGDVLAGVITGLCARGADAAQGAVWGTHLHEMAGDRLSASIGPIGYLASELLPEIPRALVEIGAG